MHRFLCPHLHVTGALAIKLKWENLGEAMSGARFLAEVFCVLTNEFRNTSDLLGFQKVLDDTNGLFCL